MTARAKTQPKDDGAAARKEAGGEPLTVEFHGLELELPAKLPFKMLPLIAKLQASEKRPELQAPALVNFVEGILDGQAEDVWNLDLDLEAGAEQLGELFTEIMGSYGLTEGKSEASPAS